MWILYALLHSLFRAMLVETGRFSPSDGWVRAFWQAVFGVVFLLPLLPFMHWPADRDFYIAGIGVGMIMTVGCLLQLGLSARQSGRITSISMPVETLTAFMIWVVLAPIAFDRGSPSDFFHYAAMIAAFALAVIALLIIRPNDISLRTVMLVAPIGGSFAVAGVVTKLVLPAADLIPVVLAYALVNFAVMVTVMGGALVVKHKLAVVRPSVHLLKGGAVTALFAVSSYVTFAAGVVLAPNPGYVNFMAMLLPVWMIGLHRLFRAQERASAVAAFLLVISTAILILAVS